MSFAYSIGASFKPSADRHALKDSNNGYLERSNSVCAPIGWSNHSVVSQDSRSGFQAMTEKDGLRSQRQTRIDG